MLITLILPIPCFLNCFLSLIVLLSHKLCLFLLITPHWILILLLTSLSVITQWNAARFLPFLTIVGQPKYVTYTKSYMDMQTAKMLQSLTEHWTTAVAGVILCRYKPCLRNRLSINSYFIPTPFPYGIISLWIMTLCHLSQFLNILSHNYPNYHNHFYVYLL